MYFSKQNSSNSHQFKKYIRTTTFQRILAGVLTLLVAFVIVYNGAAPKKYKLNIGDKSLDTITSPRDIENSVITRKNREKAAAAVTPVMKDINGASIEVLNSTDDFMTLIENERKTVEKNILAKGLNKSDEYKKVLSDEQEAAVGRLVSDIKKLNVPLSEEQVRYLVAKTGEEEISGFKKTTKDFISSVMKEDVSRENLAGKIDRVQNDFQNTKMSQDLKIIGGLLAKAVMKPNRSVDDELTRQEKDKAILKAENIVVVKKDERILSPGDLVTEDKYEILRQLNLLETSRRFDWAFALGVLMLMMLLAYILIIYMRIFHNEIFKSRNNIFLLCSIILMTLLIARGISEYSAMAIPIFMAPMLISILLDLKLAGVVNFALTLLVTFITKGEIDFVYMSLICGTLAAFLVNRTSQRSRLFLTGVIVGVLNVIVIVCLGIINKGGFNIIARESIIVFMSGILSIVLTTGTLPFWESTFNVITPLKLLELSNPNQPLIKRLLMEAPGTYHHSLMVGNMAEIATEAIGGNALLARVGAYFHDVGKLKRPNFFMENQMSDNPHDRMTANLSTLVITAHTRDGVELARKYKIPQIIQEMISQHHGNTLVAYFYHKAKKGEKGEEVKQENFRYEGPKPSTKEAAVVMLADSVEAAVRSMLDKTEGKIEGLVRKIIKEKLDDGQLDQCNLTLKDLDYIAKGFMQTFSGLFHEREEYPEIRLKNETLGKINMLETGNGNLESRPIPERSASVDNLN